MSSKWVQAVLATQPSNWWRFTEHGGDEIKDLFGGFHLPRYMGSSDWSEVGLLVADHDGGLRMPDAVSFNRRGTSLDQVPPAAAGNTLTIGFWLEKDQNPSTTCTLIGSVDATTFKGVYVALTSGGNILARYGNGTTFVNSTSYPATDEKHFWLIAMDASNVVIYRDGVRVVQDAGITFVGRGTANPNNGPFMIGGDGVTLTLQQLFGVLDEVLVWSRMITDEEALSMAEAAQEDVDLQRYVDWLPRHLHDDPNVRAVLQAMGREVLRYDNAWADLLDQLFVQTATWGLRYWEQSLLLPMEPVGQTLEERRGIVLTTLQAKDAVSGEDFNAAIAAITPHYTLEMDWDTSTLNVTLNINPDAYTQAQVETILRALIPAHLLYNVQYEAFIAGISTAGDVI
jgi:uncharacterized protein YmfQ (DUF2313 family)